MKGEKINTTRQQIVPNLNRMDFLGKVQKYAKICLGHNIVILEMFKAV